MMPLSDGNPFVLARLAPGIAYIGDLKFSRPFDNGGTSDIVTGGATGGNEFTLDGSPNMANGRRVAFVPPAGAVQEFKVETASFDAAQRPHGGAHRQRDAQERHQRAEGVAATPTTARRSSRRRTSSSEEQGAEAGARLQAPGVHARRAGGHPRALRRPRPVVLLRRGGMALRRVPGAALADGADRGDAQRRLLGAAVPRHHHPRPADRRRRSATASCRTPFAGNIIPPGRINPIAQKVLSYYPLPNQAGNATGSGQLLLRQSAHRRLLLDLDALRSRAHVEAALHGALHAERSPRSAQRAARHGRTAIVPTGNFLFRKNDGVTVNHTYTQSANSLWDVRAGWQQFREPNVRQHEGIFDPASLGLSSGVTSLFSGARYFPLFNFDTIRDIGDNLAGNTEHTIYSFQPTYTQADGQPLDARRLRHAAVPRVQRQPRTAGRASTTAAAAARSRAQQDNSAVQDFQDVASFLLGLPTGGTIDRNGIAAERHAGITASSCRTTGECRRTADPQPRPALRLRGRRPPNRRTATSAASIRTRCFRSPQAAEARYAANPIPQIARVGMAGAGRRAVRVRRRTAGSGTPTRTTSSRASASPTSGTTGRSSAAAAGSTRCRSSSPASNQMGYSQSTPFTATQDRGLTFQSTLNNPYPLGILEAAGNTRGPNTFLGQSLDRFAPLDFKNGQLARLPGQRAARAAGPVAARGRLCRQPRLRPGDERRAEQRARPVPVDQPRSAIRRRSTSSASRCPTRSPASCRPAIRARTSRGRSSCGRSRSSTTCRPTSPTARASTTRRR